MSTIGVDFTFGWCCVVILVRGRWGWFGSGVVAVGMAIRWGGGLGFDFVRLTLYPPISVK